MHLLTILGIAVSSNLDNLGVGLAYGTKKIRLPVSSNLLIAVITSCGTVISMVFGRHIAFIARNQRLTSAVGAGIIVAVGLYLLVQSLRKKDIDVSQRSGGRLWWLREIARLSRDPTLADRDSSRSIDPGEAAILGIALTLNNLPNGFAAGLIGLSPALTTAAVFVFSLLLLWVGIWFGSRFASRLLGSWTGPAAGIMLVALGVYELLQ